MRLFLIERVNVALWLNNILCLKRAQFSIIIIIII